MAGFAYPIPLPTSPLKGEVRNVPRMARVTTPIPAFPLKGEERTVPGTARVTTPIPSFPLKGEGGMCQGWRGSRCPFQSSVTA